MARYLLDLLIANRVDLGAGGGDRIARRRDPERLAFGMDSGHRVSDCYLFTIADDLDRSDPLIGERRPVLGLLPALPITERDRPVRVEDDNVLSIVC